MIIHCSHWMVFKTPLHTFKHSTCTSKCGPWISIISITSDLVRNTKFHGLAEDKLIQNLKYVTCHSMITDLCGWFRCIIELKPGQPNSWVLFHFLLLYGYFSSPINAQKQRQWYERRTWWETFCFSFFSNFH